MAKLSRFFASSFGDVRRETAGKDARVRSLRDCRAESSIFFREFRGGRDVSDGRNYRVLFAGGSDVSEGRNYRYFFAKSLGGFQEETWEHRGQLRGARARSAGAAVYCRRFRLELDVWKRRNFRIVFVGSCGSLQEDVWQRVRNDRARSADAFVSGEELPCEIRVLKWGVPTAKRALGTRRSEVSSVIVQRLGSNLRKDNQRARDDVFALLRAKYGYAPGYGKRFLPKCRADPVLASVACTRKQHPRLKPEEATTWSERSVGDVALLLIAYWQFGIMSAWRNARREAWQCLLPSLRHMKQVSSQGTGAGKGVSSFGTGSRYIVVPRVAGKSRRFISSARRVGRRRFASARSSPGAGVNRRRRRSKSLEVRYWSSFYPSMSTSACLKFLVLCLAAFGASRPSCARASMRGAVPVSESGALLFSRWASCCAREGRSLCRGDMVASVSRALRARDVWAESCGHRLGGWRKKCFQRVLIECCQGLMRGRAEQWFRRKCQNHAGSCLHGNAVEAWNCAVSLEFLVSEHSFVWIVGATNYLDVQEGNISGCWMFGDSTGDCVGSCVWVSREQHVSKLVGPGVASELFSRFGVFACAPWFHAVVAGPKGRRPKAKAKAAARGDLGRWEAPAQRLDGDAADAGGPGALGHREETSAQGADVDVAETSVSASSSSKSLERATAAALRLRGLDDSSDDSVMPGPSSLAAPKLAVPRVRGLDDSSGEEVVASSARVASSAGVPAAPRMRGLDDSSGDEVTGLSGGSAVRGSQRLAGRARRTRGADRRAQAVEESKLFQPAVVNPALCQALVMEKVQCPRKKAAGTEFCKFHRKPYGGTVTGALPVKVLAKLRRKAAGLEEKKKEKWMFTRYHMWQQVAKKHPEVDSLQALSNEQYEVCRKEVHRYLMKHKDKNFGYVRPGKGVQEVSDRCETKKFGSEAEHYNGEDGGKFFKWFSREIFQLCLRQMGRTEETCTERQCMEALVATRDEIQRYPQRQASLKPFAGPQCYAHLNRKGSDYRGNANVPISRRKRCEVSPVSALLDAKRWKQCCKCSKWRFLDEDSACHVADRSFFEERDTDRDWAEWLEAAGQRYRDFVRVQQGSVQEEGCGPGVELDPSSVQELPESEHEGEDIWPGLRDFDGSDAQSEESDAVADGQLTLGVRDALDDALGGLAGAGPPGAANVAEAERAEAATEQACPNRVRLLRERRLGQLKSALVRFVTREGNAAVTLEPHDLEHARSCFLAGDERFGEYLVELLGRSGLQVPASVFEVLKVFKAGAGQHLYRKVRFECCMLQAPQQVDGATSWRAVSCEDGDDFSAMFSMGFDVKHAQVGDEVLLVPVERPAAWRSPEEMCAAVGSDTSIQRLPGEVTFSGDAEPMERSRGIAQKLLLRSEVRGVVKPIFLKILQDEEGLGEVRLRGGASKHGMNTRKRAANQNAHRDGFLEKYRIVLSGRMERRVLKYPVRLREQALRATEAMHMILSKQVMFECKVCKERFAAFHPAYEPPQEVAAAMEVLRRGKGGLAACSTEVSSWDEVPSFDGEEGGLAPHHTGECACCQMDMDAQAVVQQGVEGEVRIVAKRSEENHMDPCFRFPREELQELFDGATMVEAMLVALEHMQVHFVTCSSTGLRKFRRNVISFPQDLSAFVARHDLARGYRVHDRVNSVRGPGRDAERLPVKAWQVDETKKAQHVVTDGGDLVFPARVKEVLFDGKLLLEYDHGGEGVELPDSVWPRAQMPWHPRDVPLVLNLRRNLGRGVVLEGLHVRWWYVARLLHALRAHPPNGHGPWRIGGLEQEPMHKHYDPRMFDVLSEKEMRARADASDATLLPEELKTAEDFTVAGFRVRVSDGEEGGEASQHVWVEEKTFSIWLQLGNLQVSEAVAQWWTGLTPEAVDGEEEVSGWKEAGDDTLVDLFKRVQAHAKDMSPEAVRLDCLRSDALQRWLEAEIGEARLGLESGENLSEQLLHELGVVEDMKPGVEERGSMEEAVDRADEDAQAKSLAEHLVYGWPSKATEPVEVRNAGRFVKAHPLDFPMGVGDLHDPDRPRKVSVVEWVQHLLRYRDGRFVRGLRGQRVLWAVVNELLLSEARQRGFAVYRSVRRRMGYGIQGGGVLTKGELRDMLRNEQSVRMLTNQLMTLGRDVRTSPMFWSYEGKKLDAAVKHMSWLPPWVEGSATVEQEGTKFLGPGSETVRDRVGLGRTATTWWTQNCKYNAVHDVHRLNVHGAHALEALDVGVDSYRGVRQAFARDSPDLVAQQIVLRTELNMQMVMPSVVKHSWEFPYKAMARFETGTGGGNLHAHGLSYGSDAPKMPRRIRAAKVEEGDESSEALQGVGEEASEESAGSDEEGQGAETRGAAKEASRVASGVVSVVAEPALREGSSSEESEREAALGEHLGDAVAFATTQQEQDASQEVSRSVADVQSVRSLVEAFLSTKGLEEDIPGADLRSAVLDGLASGDAMGELSTELDSMVERGELMRLVGEEECFQKVPPVPEHRGVVRGDIRRALAGRRGPGVRGDRIEGGSEKADLQKEVQRKGVGNKDDVERQLSEYFNELVSTWNPCLSEDGVRRFEWDAEVGAHDVEVVAGEEGEMSSEARATEAVPHRWPERIRLSGVLRDVFWAKGEKEPHEVDLQPLRRLVAALVEKSARHDLHGKDRPRLGVHACARGKASCPVCRYGFPIKDLRPRVGRCLCALEKGDREGQWHLRMPRNDELCCSYEDHVLLANLGNIDWRPCLNLWAVVQYVSKYATKAPKGSRRIFEVLSDAVDDVCRFVPKEQDFLRRSIQRFFARTLGERDYHVYEAVHVGLGLPLVVPLLPVVTLNTSGARALKPRVALKDAPNDAPVHYDSKIDKFDNRYQILRRQFQNAPESVLEVELAKVRGVSLYEFWWKYVYYRGKFVRHESTSALMVTPSFSADCANVEHPAHEGYAKACVIAYWRLMPTSERRDLYSSCTAGVDLPEGHWGHTEFVQPSPSAGFPDSERLLGVQDLYHKFEGRMDSRGNANGWTSALLEMLVDPVLQCWVPQWVREQYERANPYFRRVLEQTLTTVDSNRKLLSTIRRRMVRRHHVALLSKAAEGEGGARDGNGSDTSEGAGVGEDGMSEDEEGAVEKLGQGADDENAEDRRVELDKEPRPAAGVEGDEGTEERDWARAGLAERLSAAGAAPPAPDRKAGCARDAGSRDQLSGPLYNPKDYPWEEESVVHWSDESRLKGLLDSWKGAAVGDGADGVEREDLDGWQKFAHDIASGEPAVTEVSALRQGPRRFFLIGTAGTGKSRTVRSFVVKKRAVVKREHERKINSRRRLGVGRAVLRAMEEDMQEDVRFCCQLGAPTGCASFQLKFGASTLHRVYGVPVGYCGPAGNRTTEKYKIKQKRMKRARLWVLDEMSMVGRRMLGKIEFKVRDHLGNASAFDGSQVYMGDKDLVLCGDPKQCPPIGDEPLYQEGEYSGKGENKPKNAQEVPAGAWSAKKLVRMGLEVRNSCKDVVILRKVHRYRDSDSSLPAAQQALYAEEAAKFLEATRGMADCTWTPSQRDWLARRNRSSLQQTEEGRRQLARCSRGPLLMDTKVDRSTGQVGANRVNQMKLEELSARTGKPIVSLGAYHDKPKRDKDLRPEKLDSDDFRGLEATLLMCEGARVLLTENIWVESGLMNGALGTLKGYMWPAGGDPNSADSKLRSPLCLLVAFDNLNLKDEQGRERSFFPDDPEKKNWVPIFRQRVFSSTDENVYREQYPVVLAWALTHYKAQGMTLDTARVHLSTKTAGVAGLAFVACTRVRHPWDLVFEEDLPEYEHFMKAKKTPAFRMRRRWELRLQERASATIRKYGFCEEDVWTKEETEVAASLLRSLGRVAERQRETLREKNCFVDDDAWLWPSGEPEYETLLRDAARQLAGAGGAQRLARRVSQRLLDQWRRRRVSGRECEMADELLAVAQEEGLVVDADDVLRSVAGEDEAQIERYAEVARLVRRRMEQCGSWDGLIEEPLPPELVDLHMPAVRGSLGTLIPQRLHGRLDKAVAKEKLPADSARGGSFLKLDGWRVSVYEEDALRRGRLDKGMLEFFLKLLSRIVTEMSLSVSVGSSTMGKLIGTATSLEGFCSVVSRWRECWNPEEVKGRSVLLIPVAVDDVATPRDWVLVAVQAIGAGAGVKLGGARQLEVRVYDRTARRFLNERVARFVHALFHGTGSDVLQPVILQEQLPDCQVSTQRSGCVLGVLAGLVQRHAGQAPLDGASPTFLPDCFLVFTCVFMHLRKEHGARALSDLSSYVVGDEARRVLAMFSVVPCMRSGGGVVAVMPGADAEARCAAGLAGHEDMARKLMMAGTWNVSGGRASAQAPEKWLLADQAAAVEQEVLRWNCDVVALQEVTSPEALASLLPRYNFVGASQSHCGFVQLYLGKHLEFSRVDKEAEGVLVCQVVVRTSPEDGGKKMTVAAVHLPSGVGKAPARCRALSRVARGAEESGVLILGDMNCKDEEALQVCKKCGLREACYSGCSWGARGNKFDAHCDYEGFGLRYDRMLTAGRVWAETFLVGQRKTFFEGCEFFLSDHHPVLGVVDCHDTFRDSGRAAVAMARARRARVVAARDILAREEQVSSFEWLKRGREDKACERQHAAEERRIAAWREQREALMQRARRGEERFKAAFGPRSVWERRLEGEELPRLAKVCLHGWAEEDRDVEVPPAVF